MTGGSDPPLRQWQRRCRRGQAAAIRTPGGADIDAEGEAPQAGLRASAFR